MKDIKALSDQVRQTAFGIHVYHAHGHLEKVYENALAHRLRKAGLDDKKDVTIIETAFPTMKPVLLEKKADLVTSVLPFSEDPELNAKARTLYTEGQALGPNSLGLWVVRGELIRNHRAALVDLLEDYLRVLRFYTDPANHQEVTEIAAKLTNRPAATFSWAFTKRDYYRDPSARVDVQSLKNNVNAMLGPLQVKP